jgi:hypothetical protein
MSTRSP